MPVTRIRRRNLTATLAVSIIIAVGHVRGDDPLPRRGLHLTASAVPDADDRLHDLLVAVIAECEAVRVAPDVPLPSEVAEHSAPQVA